VILSINARQKYPKADYLCCQVKAIMNIQLIVVLVLFAIAVYFTARKLIHLFGKKKQTGCAGCGSEIKDPKSV